MVQSTGHLATERPLLNIMMPWGQYISLKKINKYLYNLVNEDSKKKYLSNFDNLFNGLAC